MKKVAALLLALTLCLSLTAAFAEENVIEVEVCGNGAWVPFADYGFQICMPAGWSVLEVNEEQASAGIIFSTMNPEATRSFTVAYSELDEASSIEAIAAELATVYPDVEIISINGLDYVTYTIAENDVTGVAALGGAGIGMYQFVFSPASDADYSMLALQIAASISVIE